VRATEESVAARENLVIVGRDPDSD
jgi:hypothetical protein